MIHLKHKVEHCLKKYPETRNSDIKLTNSIWVEYYYTRLIKDEKGNLAVKLLDLYDLPREDNVKRIRAKIQNEENRLLPTSKKVAKQRRINEDKWRAYMGFDNPATGWHFYKYNILYKYMRTKLTTSLKKEGLDLGAVGNTTGGYVVSRCSPLILSPFFI